MLLISGKYIMNFLNELSMSIICHVFWVFLESASFNPLNVSFRWLSCTCLSCTIVFVCHHLLSSVYFRMSLYTLPGASLLLHLHAVSLFVPLVYFRPVSVFPKTVSGTNKCINLYRSGGVFLVGTELHSTVNT